ncbi:MAG: NUDIX domain-containing protein [Alphaproteobacteria bacterium]
MSAKARPPVPVPSHPDLQLVSAETGFARHIRVDVVRFRHRLFAGGWSEERVFDIIRRGEAVAVLLYDPDRDSVVLVEQFRLAALYGGRSPWQIENVAGLIDADETPEAVARRETREESNLEPLGPLIPIQRMLPASGSLDEVIWLYCARIDSRSAAGLYGLADEHEDIRVIVKTLAEAEAMLDTGQIERGHTLVAL